MANTGQRVTTVVPKDAYDPNEADYPLPQGLTVLVLRVFRLELARALADLESILGGPLMPCGCEVLGLRFS